MQILQTIEEVHRVFNTSGSSPLLVTCDDFRDWVCKYDRAPKNLFNELLAAKFAKIWGINIPEVALINVKKEHVPFSKFSIQPNLFDKECFGSLYLESSKEVDHSLVHMFEDLNFREKLINKDDFLKIALFDIWLANEDRNHNNFNLLVEIGQNKQSFLYAIDHVSIFNSSYLNYGISEITEDDSIIKTKLAKILFNNNRYLVSLVDILVGNFYLCVDECFLRLDEIFNLVPDSWGVDKLQTKTSIVGNLFTESWKDNCIENFRRFIQTFIIN